MDLRVVLVDPENPLNVGFAARAMRAFGVSDLVIAASKWKAMPAEAFVTGVSAPEILDAARFESGLEGALAGCGEAIAFSRRPTALRQDEFTLPALPASLGRDGRTALVFGRESTGLTRAEAALCPRLARIPCENGVSLNLGQAVAVALFSLTATATAKDRESPRPPKTAPLERMTALWEYVRPKLAASPRFTEERLRRVRQVIYRMQLDELGFDVLFSAIKTISK